MHGLALNRLNPPQRDAVLHCDGPLLVLAGAGSGKTRVIIEKIAHLVASKRYPAKRIAAITFTNKSAREMRERVGRRIKGDDAQELTVSTFHSLGLRILQIEHARIGLRRGFSIFDADDSAGQIKPSIVMGSHVVKLKPNISQQTSAAKERLRTTGVTTRDQRISIACASTSGAGWKIWRNTCRMSTKHRS